ncbi:MAG: CHASE3 domain-containing protein [Deltaproteobacteria bacterium]|nr:CHASE3 domain-containing protein [Deltaproteobacteria bacterium]
MGIRTQIALGYAAAVAALLLLAGFFWSSAHAVSDSEASVSHTLEVSGKLQETLAILLDDQAASRGYALSGDERELEPTVGARARTHAALDDLAELLADNPAQLARLEQLRSAADRRLDEAERLVAARRTQGPGAAAARTQEGASRELMSEVHRLVDNMDSAEDQLLGERTVRAQETLRNATRNSAFAALAAVLVLTVSGIALSRSLGASISRFDRAVERVNKGELGYRIRTRRHDELGRLAYHLDVLAAQRQDDQARVQRTQALLDAAVGASPLAVASMDLEGRVQTWNDAAEQTFGWSREEILGEPLPVVPEDRKEEFARVRSRALAGELVRFQTRRLRKNGELFNARVSTGPLRVGMANEGLFAVIEDVTRRQLVEAEHARLLAAERQFTALLESIIRASVVITEATVARPGDLISVFQAIVDEARVITGAEFCALGMYAGEGHPMSPWVVSGVGAEVVEAIGRAPRPLGTLALGSSSLRMADVGRHPAFRGLPSGHPRVGPFLGVPVHSRGQAHGSIYLSNHPGGALFSDADQRAVELLAAQAGVVIENAQLHARLEREKSRLKLLADAGAVFAQSLELEPTLQNIATAVVPVLGDACLIHMLEDDGTIRRAAAYSVDKRLEQLLAELKERFPLRTVDRESAVARTIRIGRPRILKAIPPDEPEDDAQDSEHLLLLRELDLRSMLSVPLRTPQGTLGALTCLSSKAYRFTPDDLQLAEELATRASLSIQNARLYRTSVVATRAREHVLAVVSHDLKNPLNAVGLAAEGLRRKGSELVQHQAGIILRSAHRMQRLIAGVLDGVKLESGQLVVELAPVPAGELVEAAVEEIRPTANDRGLSIEVALPPLPDVNCDRDRALQVFSNLLGNAVKFTPRGGAVFLSARPRGAFVEFEIADTGPGIEREALAHVFDRFWRAPHAPTTGAGLGLFIAKGIVEAHGGRIWGESEPGHGARFVFTLPVAHDGEATEAGAPS